jgi:hypothetical protein
MVDPESSDDALVRRADAGRRTIVQPMPVASASDRVTIRRRPACECGAGNSGSII